MFSTRYLAGGVAEVDLCRVALALVDLHAILGEGEGRQLVLGLVPETEARRIGSPCRAEH